MSKKYQTSLTSTAIRFSEIGNHPIMIVFCRDNKIVWKWNSKDFPYFYLKNDKILPKDTTAAEFFNLNRSYKRTQEVFADDWFKVYDKRYERKFYEHCLCSANNNCTLSILWEK